MATFQSQLNILASANCGIHKRIADLENNQIMVKYNAENTEFYMGSETEQIKYLGYKAYDAILLFKDSKYYLMDYIGKCEKFEDDNKSMSIHFNFKDKETVPNIGTYAITDGVILDADNNEVGIILNEQLEITKDDYDNPCLSPYNIIYYITNESTYGFIKLTKEVQIQEHFENGNVQTIDYWSSTLKKYINCKNYQNIKFIDLKNPITDDDSWTLPSPPN